MRKLLLVFVSLLFIAPLALATVLWLTIEDRPSVDRNINLTPDHIGRAKKIVDAHRHWVKPGMLAVVTITPDDAELAAHYLAHHFWKGKAELVLTNRNADIRLSVPMSRGPLNGYVNVESANFYCLIPSLICSSRRCCNGWSAAPSTVRRSMPSAW